MAELIDNVRIDFTGFRPETVDKVRRLLIVLDRIAAHPLLKSKVCLHGGTAINLFFLGAPRLSVDIDLNYIGSTDRETMHAERPPLERAIMDIGDELGFRVEPGIEEHSGRSFKLVYSGIYGSDFVKIDVDYLNRSPLLRPRWRQIALPDGSEVAFPLNSDIELIGGKLKALLGRVVPRDLFDIYKIADIYPGVSGSGDAKLLRRIILYYSALSNPFPRPFDVVGRFANREREVEEILYPMLIGEDRPELKMMIEIAASFVESVTSPTDDAEKEYMGKAAKGEFDPELLFADYPDTLVAAINDPAAAWKMKNLRKLVRYRVSDNQ